MYKITCFYSVLELCNLNQMYIIAFQIKPGVKTCEAIYIPRHSIIKKEGGWFT